MKKSFAFAFVLVVVIAATLSAKRLQPAPVAPVTHNNVKYSSAGDGQKGYVVATDVVTGKELWRAEIFHVHLDPFLEKDVQDVYITTLKLVDDILLVKDEKSHCYSLDLTTHKVTKKPVCF